jgi:spore maturation protein CgeB
MDSARLLIVGHIGATHVGSHLRRAADALGLATEMCDAAEAYAGPAWRRRTDWWLRGRRPSRLDAFGQAVLQTARRFKPAVALTTGLAPIAADVVESLGAMGIVRVNFLTDDPWNPAHRAPWFFEGLGRYDHVFTPRHANLDDLNRAGCSAVHYLPFGYDPAVHFIEPPASADDGDRYRADVMLAGGADRDRVAVVSALARAGLDVAVYGGYWDRFPETAGLWRGWLDPGGLRRATGAASVALGLVRRANRDGHAMRSFEVPAMGGCLLAEATDDHRDVFGADGEAVQYFATPEDAIAVATRLVGDESRRRRLAANAHAVVTRGGHTYQDRLRALLERALGTHAQDRDCRSGSVSRV